MSRKETPFPTKEAVLRFVRESPGRVGKREIARAFGIRGHQRVALKQLLRELENEGAVESERRRIRPPGTLPNVCVIVVSDIDVDGELRARPARWEAADAPPTIVIAAQARGVPALGIGDRVLARLSRNADGGYDAKPIRLLDAARRQILGVYNGLPGGGGQIQPTDRRAKRDYGVREENAGGARSGDLVLAEALSERRHGLTEAKVLERLGAMDAPHAISLLAIHSHGLPTHFTDEALAQAKAARAPALGQRADLRAVPLVTIDGPDARDFDDAVWAEPDTEPSNPGGWRLIVAIADVAHFVRPGTALDKAARERGNSVYFPDRVVPMLPDALSGNLCSLKPGVDRACLAAHLRIDADGRLVGQRFERALMRSAARLTYVEAQKAVDGDPDETTADLVDPVLAPLFDAYQTLRTAREARGALELDLPERVVRLAPDGSVAGIGTAPRYDSHRVIEEFMIAANVAAATALEARRALCLYRIHDHPDLAKIEALREFLDGIGLKLSRGRRLTAESFNQILRKTAGTEHAEVANLVVLRSQAQAAYSPDNVGHFGLGLPRYAHFTSPIRRYADLVVHRALIRAFRLGPDAPDALELPALREIGEQVSRTERRAQAAERDAVDRYTTAYLAERVGAEFAGRINGVTRFGAFVTLDETGADGLVPASGLGLGRPHFDPRRSTLTVDGQTIRLGDRVGVRLLEADSIVGSLVFALTEVDGRSWNATPAAPDRRGGRRRRR